VNPLPTNADVIIIGTGPLALIEGLHLSEAGRHVTFIDSSEVVGGSWRSVSCLGFENIEVGVHLIENRFRVNQWMRDQLGAQFLDQRKQSDFGLVKGKHFSISATRILLHSLVTGKALLHGRLGAASRTFLSTCRAVSQFYAPFLYPNGGFSLLIQVLVKQLKRHNAKFVFGTNIQLLSPKSNNILLISDHGELEAEQVVMFSRAHAPIDSLPDLNDYIEIGQSHSMVLLLSGPAITFNGYVEILGDSLLKRVRNIGLFTRPIPRGGDSLICVQTRQDNGENHDKVIHKRLIDIGLLDSKTLLLDSFRDTFTLKTLTRTGARIINNRLSPKIVVHESTDFADCFDTHLKERLTRQ
jgi:protoporphyrinogen oxidase